MPPISFRNTTPVTVWKFETETCFPDSPANDEVVAPLLEAATDFRHPKKAAYGGQTRGLNSHQSDQAQMDDIYFTSE